jgi:hypothetical protein
MLRNPYNFEGLDSSLGGLRGANFEEGKKLLMDEFAGCVVVEAPVIWIHTAEAIQKMDALHYSYFGDKEIPYEHFRDETKRLFEEGLVAKLEYKEQEEVWEIKTTVWISTLPEGTWRVA